MKALLLSALLAFLCGHSTAAERKPNIIIVLIDDDGTLIILSITIVIDPIKIIVSCSRVDGCIGIIAIGSTIDIRVKSITVLVIVRGKITILIQSVVPNFCCTRIDLGIQVLTVSPSNYC